jgi:hypothetical protein
VEEEGAAIKHELSWLFLLLNILTRLVMQRQDLDSKVESIWSTGKGQKQ